MKQWYLTREGINAFHRGEELKPNKYVLLTEKQAFSHNKRKQFLVEALAPSEPESCQSPEDWKVWQSLQETKVKRNKDAVAEDTRSRLGGSPAQLVNPAELSGRSDVRKEVEISVHRDVFIQ